MTESIDSLVAQHVMGWELLHVGYYGTEDASPRQIELEDWLTDVGINSVGDYWINAETKFWMNAYGYRAWQPSTNIAQAFQVLEQFRSTHNIYLVTLEKRQWCCDLEGASVHVSEIADSAPMAVCLAALAVKGVKVPSV